MVIVATALIILGGICALMGQKVFRILLPIVGFVAGVMVGFGGVQGVFGTGVVSLAVALIMALIVGLIMAVLSFMFYEIAVIILIVMLGATAFSYLGVALGLENNGFVLFLLAIAGGVLGFVFSTRTYISLHLVFVLTAFLGTAFVLAGVFLFIGEVDLDQLQDTGIIRSVLQTIDQSLIWFLVWIGASIIALNFQYKVAQQEFLDDAYAFKESLNS